MPRTSRPLSILPITVREVSVLGIEDVTPSVRRLTLGGPAMRAGERDGHPVGAFRSTGFDDHVKVVVPDADGTQPFAGRQDGERFAWAPGVLPFCRDYTVRRVAADGLSFEIDVVRHPSGRASDWAFSCAVGDRVSFAGPKMCADLPDGIDWYLLVADETGLPAVTRWLEEAPAGTRARIVVEVPSDADRQLIDSAADAEITWLVRGPQVPAGHSRALLGAVQGFDLPAGRGFAWVAGESTTIAPIRSHLRQDGRFDRKDIEVVGYWRRTSTTPSVPEMTTDVGDAQASGGPAAPTSPAHPPERAPQAETPRAHSRDRAPQAETPQVHTPDAALQTKTQQVHTSDAAPQAETRRVHASDRAPQAETPRVQNSEHATQARTPQAHTPQAPDPMATARQIHEMSELLAPIALRVAVTLGIPAHLAAGATHIDELAALTGVPSARLAPLLDALLALGLVERSAGADDRSAHSSAVETQRPDVAALMTQQRDRRQDSLRNSVLGERLLEESVQESLDLDHPANRAELAFVGLLDTLRNGRVAAEPVIPADVATWRAQDPDVDAAFHARVEDDLQWSVQPLCARTELVAARSVLLLGDGTVATAVALTADPGRRVHLVVPPAQVDATRDRVVAEIGAAHRGQVEVVATDRSLPEADVAVVQLAQDGWNDATFVDQARRLRDAAGHVLFVTRPADGAATDDHVAADALTHLATTGVPLRTSAATLDLLAQAGLEDARCEPLGWGFGPSVISASRPTQPSARATALPELAHRP